jgi:hypothetical protein
MLDTWLKLYGLASVDRFFVTTIGADPICSKGAHSGRSVGVEAKFVQAVSLRYPKFEKV